MIDFEKAKEIAKEYYSGIGMNKLTKVYENDEMWIVYATKDDQTQYGGCGISINKETGDASKFILPSKKNFEILKKAKLIIVE